LGSTDQIIDFLNKERFAMTDQTLGAHRRPDVLRELYDAISGWRSRRRQRRQVRKNLKVLDKLDRRSLEDIGMNTSGLRGAGHALELTVLTAGLIHDTRR
jgi:hypothetical protein